MDVNGWVRSRETMKQAIPRPIQATPVVYSTALRRLNSSENVSVVSTIRKLYRKYSGRPVI